MLRTTMRIDDLEPDLAARFRQTIDRVLSRNPDWPTDKVIDSVLRDIGIAYARNDNPTFLRALQEPDLQKRGKIVEGDQEARDALVASEYAPLIAEAVREARR